MSAWPEAAAADMTRREVLRKPVAPKRLLTASSWASFGIDLGLSVGVGIGVGVIIDHRRWPAPVVSSLHPDTPHA